MSQIKEFLSLTWYVLTAVDIDDCLILIGVFGIIGSAIGLVAVILN